MNNIVFENDKSMYFIHILQGRSMPFYMSAFLAGLGGFAGGFVGNPADLVNVRMQNDVKLPPEQRRK